jgi:hypothetical protein
MLFSNINKGGRVFGYFSNALVTLPKDLSVSGFHTRTFSSLLVVTFMVQKGLAESGIVRPLSLYV